MKASIPFEKHHLEFLSDPERARAYLEITLEEYATDQNTSALLLALKDIAAAQGGLGKLAQQTNLNRAHIYKALSREGNPRLDTLEKILNSLGFRLSIEPLEREKQKA